MAECRASVFSVRQICIDPSEPARGNLIRLQLAMDRLVINVEQSGGLRLVAFGQFQSLQENRTLHLGGHRSDQLLERQAAPSRQERHRGQERTRSGTAVYGATLLR